MTASWRLLLPLQNAVLKSWNHITKLRHLPIAINIETKGPMKSWTDGKPQIAIWTDAWLNRLDILYQDKCRQASTQYTSLQPPSIPVLIAQGHDWHLLIITKTEEKMVVREQIGIGNTRNCFDTMKVLAVLHWAIQWAEQIWRPWFASII